MSLADIKDFTSAVKKMTTASKATGPRTEKGKLRSALNATRHGLAGRGLLLPGEDAQVYTEKMDGIFAALGPQDDAEAELVALVADDLWKLSRLARIEKGVTLGRIEEFLALTGTAEKASITSNAITGLGTALAAWSAESIPTEKNSEFKRRFDAMMTAISLVEATVADIPAYLTEACNDLLTRLHGCKGETVVDQAAYFGLFDEARQVMTILLDQGHREDAAQDQLRADIAGVALPDEAELRKLARYRKMLEDSLQRRLAALDQLRKITTVKGMGEADPERAREFRVRLRVVA